MTPAGRRHAVRLAIVVLLAVATLLRIFLIESLHDQGWFVKYYELAGRALAGSIPVERLGDVSPAYFWSMVLMRALGMGVNAIRALQITGVTLSAVLCGAAAWIVAGRAAAVATTMLILGNRAALVLATELEPEILIMVLVSGGILATVVWQARRAAAAAVTAGILFGAAATARPVALGAIVLLAGWMAYETRRRSPRNPEESGTPSIPGKLGGVPAKASVVFLLAALLPVAVMALVNRHFTGSLAIMQPGTQFYDANNPLATGAAAVLPRIVLDLQLSSSEPDYLHVAYRVITARATEGTVDARTTNRYWSGKAFEFITAYPRRAFELFVWKGILAFHNYEVYDLYTTRQKAGELARWPAIPFGASAALSIVGIVLWRDRRKLVPVLLPAAATVAALVAFNVTARQRNALLPPVAVLGGIGAGAIFARVRQRSDTALMAFGAVVVVTPLLGIEGAPMRENDYVWRATQLAEERRRDARELQARGLTAEAMDAAADAIIFDPTRLPGLPLHVLRDRAQSLAEEGTLPQSRFDAAVALQTAGAWAESARALDTLGSYRPLRENRMVSSVDYYRARAAIHLGAAGVEVRSLLDSALRQSPGDPHVLAFRAVLGDRAALSALNAVHDPFTRDFALATAYADVKDYGRADSLLASLQARIPEWRRPARVRHALRTAQRGSGSSEARE
jgi:hypothetical protein